MEYKEYIDILELMYSQKELFKIYKSKDQLFIVNSSCAVSVDQKLIKQAKNTAFKMIPSDLFSFDEEVNEIFDDMITKSNFLLISSNINYDKLKHLTHTEKLNLYLNFNGFTINQNKVIKQIFKLLNKSDFLVNSRINKEQSILILNTNLFGKDNSFINLEIIIKLIDFSI